MPIFLLPHPPRLLDTVTKFCVLTKRTCVDCIQQEIQILFYISTKWFTEKKEKTRLSPSAVSGWGQWPTGGHLGRRLVPVPLWTSQVGRGEWDETWGTSWWPTVHCIPQNYKDKGTLLTFLLPVEIPDCYTDCYSLHSHGAFFPLNFQAGDDQLLPRCENKWWKTDITHNLKKIK